MAAFLHHTMHRQGVLKLIRENASNRDGPGHFDAGLATPTFNMRLQALSQLSTTCSRAFHSYIVERRVKLRQFDLRKIEDMTGQPTCSCRSFHQLKSRRPTELLPHLSKLLR